MGQISKKLARRFTKWSGQFRQVARTVPVPKDVRDVETLVKDGHDPTSCRLHLGPEYHFRICGMRIGTSRTGALL